MRILILSGIQLIFMAVQTKSFVNTDGSATGRAMPSFHLFLHKVYQSMVFYILQVIEQAGIVPGAVTLVELF